MKLNSQLLKQQLDKYLHESHFQDDRIKGLLKEVSDTYEHYEECKRFLERSLESSTQEVQDAYFKLSSGAEGERKMLNKLNLALTTLEKKKAAGGIRNRSTKKNGPGKEETLSSEQLVDLLIEAKESAERSCREKEQFLSTISHEIRTPMSGVIGMLNLLLKTELNEEQREYVNSIKFSADNLLVIINDVLDLSKIESGKLKFDETEFNVDVLTQSVMQMLKPKADDKGIKLRREIDENIPGCVVGDPVRLNQIMINLVGNAIKFTPSGEIVIRAKQIENTASGITVKFSVKDTGIGIEKEKLSTIFESFSQASSDTTRKYGGTGLGLTISQRLVEMQGGNMSVESEPGLGSEFSFVITYKKEMADKKPEVVEDELATNIKRDYKILLAEDNEINQRIASKLLKKWSEEIEVDIAENGLVAFEMLQEQDYDIILMDIHMPEMDGYTAARKIRKELSGPKNSTPMLAVTASVLMSDQEKVFSAGLDDFISKPFVPEVLFKKIDRYVQARREMTGIVPSRSKAGSSTIEGQAPAVEEEKTEQQIKKEINKALMEELPVTVARIKYAANSEDWGAVGRIAYELKMLAAVLGNKTLIDLLKNIESCVAAGDKHHQIPALVGEAEAQLKAALAQIKKSFGK